MHDRELATLRFNRLCHAICAFWMFVAIPFTLILRPTYQDFTLYYMAGTCARTSNWALLYPDIRVSDGQSERRDALKPGLVELARQSNVDLSMPYLQPPWNAIFFAPLSLLPFRVAHAIWSGLSILSVYGCSRYARRTYEASSGQSTRLSGVAMLLVSLSPLAYRTIRVGNVSAILAFLIAFTTFEIMRRDRARAAVAIWIGGLLKYATIVFVPLLLMMRRWRAVICVVALGLITIGGTLAICGSATFREYSVVASEINNAVRYPRDQSLYGFLSRTLHQSPLTAPVLLAKHALQIASGIVLLWLVIRRRRELESDPRILFAAVVASLAWLLIFAPLFWDHYHIYFAPFWGWMLWEASQSRVKRVVVSFAILLAWVPLPAALWFNWPEPFGSYMLWSAFAMLGVGIQRLCASAIRSEAV